MKRHMILIVAALSLQAAFSCAAGPAGNDTAAAADMKSAEATAGQVVILFEDAPSDVDVAAMIAAAPDEKAAPLDDAFLLFDHTDITLEPDGRVVRRQHQLIKIMNEYAVRNLCDPRVSWNSKTRDFVIHTLRTHMSDGTVVERTTGTDRMHNISPVTPDGLDKCPDYMHHRQAVVTFLGIDLGCTVDFDYSIRDRRPLSGWLSGAEVLQGDSTAQVRRFTLRIPAGVQIQWNELNGAPAAEENRDGDMRVLTWTMKNVPGTRIETDGVGAAGYLPAVAYTVWKGAAEDRYGWYREMMQEMEAAAQPGGVLKMKAAELCAKAAGPDEKFAKVHAFARNAVRRIGFGPLDRNEHARPAERIYDTGYASSKDHAVLLLALCRAAGLKAWPAFVSNCDVTGVLGVAGLMSDYYLVVELDHGRFLADPAQPFDRDLAMIVPAHRIFTPPKQGRPMNIMPANLSVSGELALDSGLKATGSLKVSHSGPGNPFMKLRGSEKTRDGYLKGVASRFVDGGKMTGHTVHDLARHRSSFTIDVAADAPKKEANGTIRVEVLQPARLASDILPGIFTRPPTVRSGPVALEHAVTIEADLEVTVPAGYEVAYMPGSEEMVNEYGSCSVAWSREGGKLKARYLIDLSQGIVGAGDYAGLREIMLQAGDSRSSLLVLRPAAAGPAVAGD